MTDWILRLVPTAVAVVAIALALDSRGDVTRLKKELATVTGAASGEEMDDDGPTDAREAPRARRTPREDQLARRVAALERTLSRVFQMLIAGRNRTDSEAQQKPEAPAATHQRLDNLREDVDALLTGEALESDKGRKRLHEIVQQAQDEWFEKRREQRRKMRAELHAQRLKELAEKANLSQPQVAQLDQILDQERKTRRQLFRSARRGEMPFAQAISQVRAQRQSTDARVKGLLSESQFTEYEKMRQSDRRGGWRRGR